MNLCMPTRLEKVTHFSFLSSKLDFVELNGFKTFIANSVIEPHEVLGIFGGKVVHKDEINNYSGIVHFIDDSFYMVCPNREELDSIYFAKYSETNSNSYLESSLKLKSKIRINKGDEIFYNRENDFSIQKFHSKAWGLLTSIDLENCNPLTIRSEDEIRRYVLELCELIDMKRFGDTSVVHFGEDEKVAGFSMFQLIETSCISAHFANQTNTAYIDIFSCKGYCPNVASDFTRKFFEGGKLRINVVNRF